MMCHMLPPYQDRLTGLVASVSTDIPLHRCGLTRQSPITIWEADTPRFPCDTQMLQQSRTEACHLIPNVQLGLYAALRKQQRRLRKELAATWQPMSTIRAAATNKPLCTCLQHHLLMLMFNSQVSHNVRKGCVGLSRCAVDTGEEDHIVGERQNVSISFVVSFPQILFLSDHMGK